MFLANFLNKEIATEMQHVLTTKIRVKKERKFYLYFSEDCHDTVKVSHNASFGSSIFLILYLLFEKIMSQSTRNNFNRIFTYIDHRFWKGAIE